MGGKFLHFMRYGTTATQFFFVTQDLAQCYRQIENSIYNFSEAGYGKSPADSMELVKNESEVKIFLILILFFRVFAVA